MKIAPPEETAFRKPMPVSKEDILMGEPEPVYLVGGHGCEFGGFIIPKTVRILMHGKSEALVTCRLNFNTLLEAGKSWSSYQDLLRHLGEPQYQDLWDFRVYNPGDYVPDVLIFPTINVPSGVYQFPIRPGSFRHRLQNLLTLKRVVDFVEERGGGTILLIACRSPCSKQDIYSLVDWGEFTIKYQDYAAGEPIRNLITPQARASDGLIGYRNGRPVFAKGHNFFIFEGRKEVRTITPRGSDLVYIGNLDDSTPIWADEKNLYLIIDPDPNIYRRGDKVYKRENGIPYLLDVTPGEFTPVEDDFGVALVDNHLLFLEIITLPRLLGEFEELHPGENEAFIKSADWRI